MKEFVDKHWTAILVILGKLLVALCVYYLHGVNDSLKDINQSLKRMEVTQAKFQQKLVNVENMAIENKKSIKGIESRELDNAKNQ